MTEEARIGRTGTYVPGAWPLPRTALRCSCVASWLLSRPVTGYTCTTSSSPNLIVVFLGDGELNPEGWLWSDIESELCTGGSYSW